MTKRDLRARETRRVIVDTARRLFAEKGFDNVTVDMLTAEAGVAKGSFYTYFKTKDDIEALILYERFRALYDDLNAPVRVRPRGVDTKIRAWLDTIYELITRYGFGYMRRGTTAQYAPSAENGGSLFELDTRIVGGILREGVRAGRLDAATPVDALTTQIIGAAYGLCFCAAIRNDAEALKNDLDFYAKLLKNTILKPYKKR
jgi:AcrR family transcriptional regulator